MTTVAQIVCADCGVIAPETDTPYTLISERFGWRLAFVIDGRGKRVPEWRCERCFRRSKASRPFSPS